MHYQPSSHGWWVKTNTVEAAGVWRWTSTRWRWTSMMSTMTMSLDVDDRCRWTTPTTDDDVWWRSTMDDEDDWWRWWTLMMTTTDDDECWRRVLMTNNSYTTNTTLLLFNLFLFTISQILATGNTSAQSYTALTPVHQPIPNCSTHWLTGSLGLYTAGATVWRSYIYLRGSAQTFNYMGAKSLKSEICSYNMFKTYKTTISPSLIVIRSKLTKFSKVTQN